MKKVFNIIYTYFLSSVLNRTTNDLVLPKNFEDYKYLKDLRTFPKQSFAVGLYENKNGDKVVMKKWSGKIPNTHYYNLKHEINIYKTLSKYINSQSDVSFPSYKFSEEKNNSMTLVTEFFSGKSLKNYKGQLKQGDIYDKCVMFINEIGEKLNSEDRARIRARSPKSYLLLYPILFTAAFYQNPKMIRSHFRSLLLFIKYSYLLRRNTKFSLVHGDLHQENILINGSKIKIIDLEQVMFTYPEFELATALGSMHNSFEFSQQILLKTEDLFKEDSLRHRYFTLMSIFCMTYNFTEKLKVENLKSYKRLLDFVFVLNDKSKSKQIALDIYSKNISEVV